MAHGPWRRSAATGQPRQPAAAAAPDPDAPEVCFDRGGGLATRHASTSPEHARRARRLFRQHVAYTLVYHNDGKMFVDVERVPPAPGGGAGSDTAGAAAAPSTSRMSSARTSDVATSLTCSR